MRKQVICAVLSGEDPLPSDPSTMRSNLCLCAPRYLLNIRFGSHCLEMLEVLSVLAPTCLPAAQYDPLYVLVAEKQIDFVWRMGPELIDAGELSSYVPESLADLRQALDVETRPA